MPQESLRGLKVAILVTDGFEQAELLEPRKALDEAGAETTIVSPKSGQVKGWDVDDWGTAVAVDLPLERTRANDFDALLLPGGVLNPDSLRLEPAAVNFVRGFMQARKPVAAICHGPWTLIEADSVRGRRLTSWPSLRTDLVNAGADWVDEDAVTDGNLVTSRKPADIPAFNAAMTSLLAQHVTLTR